MISGWTIHRPFICGTKCLTHLEESTNANGSVWTTGHHQSAVLPSV